VLDTTVEQTTTTEAPTTTEEAEVLSAGAEVKGQNLARTGSDPMRWVFLAGLALFVGGIAVLFGEKAAVPARR
jgi:LPXTG-motif cell wall-anchored protein